MGNFLYALIPIPVSLGWMIFSVLVIAAITLLAVKWYLSIHRPDDVKIKGRRFHRGYGLKRIDLLSSNFAPVPLVKISPEYRGPGYSCPYCGGTGGSMSYTPAQPQIWGYDTDTGNPKLLDRGSAATEIWVPCHLCRGNGQISADEAVSRYNSQATSLNKSLNNSVSKIGPQTCDKIAELNKLVELTNQKIDVWNSKALPRNQTSKDQSSWTGI